MAYVEFMLESIYIWTGSRNCGHGGRKGHVCKQRYLANSQCFDLYMQISITEHTHTWNCNATMLLQSLHDRMLIMQILSLLAQ